MTQSNPNTLRLDLDVRLLDESLALECVDRIEILVDDFNDGRVFSMVRGLRDRYRFQGTIQVRGNILPDQIDQLLRVGATSVALTNGLAEAQRPNLISKSYIEEMRT